MPRISDIAGVATTANNVPVFATANVLNKFYNHHSKLLSDAAYVNYNKYAEHVGVYLQPVSVLYMDSLLLYCPCYVDEIHNTTHVDTGSYNKAIATVLAGTLLRNCDLTAVGSGEYRPTNYIPRGYYALYSERRMEPYNHNRTCGAIVFKLSTSSLALSDVLNVLGSSAVAGALARELVVPHAVDVTIDYSGNMLERTAITHALAKIGYTAMKPTVGTEGKHIIDDIHKVGRNCICWANDIVLEDVNTPGANLSVRCRYKLYNKYVQMLESPSTRKDIGSLMHELVANSDVTMFNKLLQCANGGMTRMECTLHLNAHDHWNMYNNLSFYNVVEQYMQEHLNHLTLERVFTYCSYESQWRALAEVLVSAMQVYVPNEQVWSYCYWWNSITGKKHGTRKDKVEAHAVPWLRSAYNFPNRPLYYLECGIGEDKNMRILSHIAMCRTLAQTMHTSSNTATTEDARLSFVPGPYKSLYPSYLSLIKRASVPFKDIGLTEQNGIQLGWPEHTRYKDRSKPLCNMKVLPIPDVDWTKLLGNDAVTSVAPIVVSTVVPTSTPVALTVAPLIVATPVSLAPVIASTSTTTTTSTTSTITTTSTTNAYSRSANNTSVDVSDTVARISTITLGEATRAQQEQTYKQQQHAEWMKVRPNAKELHTHIAGARNTIREVTKDYDNVPLQVYGYHVSRMGQYAIAYDPRYSLDTFIAINITHCSNVQMLLEQIQQLLPTIGNVHVYAHKEPLLYITPTNWVYGKSGNARAEYTIEAIRPLDQIHTDVTAEQTQANAAISVLPRMYTIDAKQATSYVLPIRVLREHCEYVVIALSSAVKRNKHCYNTMLLEKDKPGATPLGVCAGSTTMMHAVLKQHEEVHTYPLPQLYIRTGATTYDTNKNKDIAVYKL